ncbi:MAG: hypothetical protein Q9187_002877 [Circinaria calcarea]
MDPFSISVGVITLIQATNGVIHLCFDYASTVKGATRAISGLLDEITSLRNILESIERLLASPENPNTAPSIELKEVAALCDREDGPIAKELKLLNEKLRLPDWACQNGSRRKALMQSLTWPLKEGETKRILENIDRLKKNLELALTVDQSVRLSQLQQGQKSLKSSMKSLHNDEQYWKIKIWLAAPDVSMNFNAALKKRHANTGLWLFETRPFQDWKAAQASFLWLHGIPGCGKTVLSSTIIEKLSQETSKCAIAYFFFDFNDSTKQHIDNMLRSLVLQLLSSFEFIPESIVSLYEACRKGTKPPQINDLERVFQALVDYNTRTFVVLDALDECESRQELLVFLESAIKRKANGLNIIITSRRLKEFDDFFHDYLSEQSIVSIQNQKVDDDIRLYIHGRLLHDRRFKRWQKQPRVQEEIENRLMKKSEGMFRWAACQIDALSSCINISKLREALDSLPTTLDETYDRILCKINPLYQLEALQILQWLTCSLRPLSLEEVAELITVDVNKDEVFDFDKRPPDPDDVLEICSSLVTCINANKDHAEANDKDDNDDVKPPLRTKRMVRLAHFSVKEYLVSNRIRAGSAAFFSIDETLSHAKIGQTSLSCLLLYDETFHTDSKGFSDDLPLAEYAAEYWAKHLVKGGGNVPHAAVDLLSSKEKMKNWIDLHDLEVKISNCRHARKLPGSPLYYAVLTRLERLVRSLKDVNEGKSQQRAADDGIETEGQKTVHNLATPYNQGFLNTRGGRLHTPLQAAAWIGQQDIIEFLVKHGADPNIYGGSEGGSALSAAAHNGCYSAVELLLHEGADVYEGLCTTLGDLQDMGLDEIDAYELPYSRFINPPFDVSDRRAKEQDRKTALFEAASCGNTEIVNLLLGRGAMVNIRNGKEGRTALFKACDHKHKDIVRSLLSKGAFVDKTDIRGCTPLMQACMSREADNDEIVRLLLEADADVKRFNPHIGTVLRAATVRGHESTVRLLLEYGADANELSPLMEALRRGHTRIAKLLVENGANVNLMEYFNNGVPLWLHQRPVTSCITEALRSILGISKLSLWPGHEIKSEEEMYGWKETPLWIAAASGDIESVKLLLDNGANSAFCNQIVNMTALDIAAFEEHEEVVNLLTAVINRQVIDPEGSEDEDELREGSVDNESLSPRRGEASRRQRSASEAASDARLAQVTEKLSDTKKETIACSKPMSPPQDEYLNDEDQQPSPSLELPSALTRPPFIVSLREKEVRAYLLAELLCKAKRESKTAKDRSWSPFNIYPLNTFLQKPDLSALRLWWEPGNPPTKEAIDRDGLLPMIARPPDVDVKSLPSIFLFMRSEEEDEDEGEKEKQNDEGEYSKEA